MIHVGLNLVFLVPGETGGMETYARELVPRLAALGDVRLTALVNRETGPGDFEGVEARVVPVRARNRIEWVRGEQQHVARMAAAAGCELLHSLGSTAPLLGRVPRVTTIHDLNYRKIEDAHDGFRGLGMRVLVPLAVRRSRRVITVSASTRDDLVADLHVPAGKIDVIPHGVTPPPATPPDAARRARERFGLGDRHVVLSVSAKRPHKNLARLIGAVAAIPAELRPVLVIPGYPTPYEPELRERARALGAEHDVVWPAWLSAAELEALYAAADCVVFPSLYEGFGLPVIEAMARGVPVATSNRSSMPEVAGGAALLFDPEDEGAIRGAVERLLADAGERERLAAAGLRRVAELTWERAAAATRDAYLRALGRTPGSA